MPATPVVSNIPCELISKTLNHISQRHRGASFRNSFLMKFITDQKKRHKDPSIQFMPHKACIPFQIGATYAALG